MQWEMATELIQVKMEDKWKVFVSKIGCNSVYVIAFLHIFHVLFLFLSLSLECAENNVSTTTTGIWKVGWDWSIPIYRSSAYNFSNKQSQENLIGTIRVAFKIQLNFVIKTLLTSYVVTYSSPLARKSLSNPEVMCPPTNSAATSQLHFLDESWLSITSEMDNWFLTHTIT